MKCPVAITLLRAQANSIEQTHMAANRGDNIVSAVTKTWARGGVFGCKSSINYLHC